MTPRSRMGLRAEPVLRAVLVAGFLLVLGANLPGHLTTDSILQLYEGRMNVRDTFGPAIYSRILGLFDAVVPGTGLYVVASGFILFASLLALPQIRGRVSWLAVPVAVGFVLVPAVLLYQGIVWKDVLFANLAIAGFVCLAGAAQSWEDRLPRWTLLILAAVLLAVATLLRQNGLVAVVMAALVLGWTARKTGWKIAIAWAIGGFVAIALLAQGLNTLSRFKTEDVARSTTVGIRILQHYDLVAAAALEPGYRFDLIDKASPQTDDAMRAAAPVVYSPERVDFFDRVPTLAPSMWPVPAEVIRAEWMNLILKHPKTYLMHRYLAFRWVFLIPSIDHCKAGAVGVEGPADKLAALKITPGLDAADEKIYAYSIPFFRTVLYEHLTYAIAAVAVGALLLLRRDPADWVVIALMISALGFTASFFVISLACDYRYLYFLDLAAMVGVLYLAIDPALWRRRRLEA